MKKMFPDLSKSYRTVTSFRYISFNCKNWHLSQTFSIIVSTVFEKSRGNSSKIYTMLSQKTLRHIEIVHQLGNWMLVSPISLNIGKNGIYGNCKVLYKGWKWQLFSWVQINCRILTLAYLSVKLLLNANTIMFEFVLFIGVFTMVVIGTNI